MKTIASVTDNRIIVECDFPSVDLRLDETPGGSIIDLKGCRNDQPACSNRVRLE